MVIEYNDKKLAFVHIGGNAGTAIEWYLFTINKKVQYPDVKKYRKGKHKHIDTIRDKGFQAWLDNQHESAQDMYDRVGEAVYFTVIRNPYERMVAKFFTSPYSNHVSKKNIKGLFRAFLTDIYNQHTPYGKKENTHVRPQMDMITYNGRKVAQVIRFENLQEDFTRFCKEYNLPVRKLIKCNSTSHPLKAMNIYTPESQKMVYTHERELIEQYGYHF